MNPLFPRIDWRGEGPGYAEMEFPFLPYTAALLSRTFEYDERFGRELAFLAGSATLGVFIALARRLLPDIGALSASCVFALNPLAVTLSRSFQPDGVMLFFSVGAVYAFARWLETDRGSYYWAAAGATAMAVLAKANAAHIGILFAILILHRDGFAAVRRGRTWLFGLVALGPAILWYGHARSLFHTYGNSLGVSNEHHWVGLDVIFDSRFISGIMSLEHQFVWTSGGLLLAAFAIVLRRHRAAVRLSGAWLCAVFLFYLVAARTAAAEWAAYYHVVAAAPVALLCGSGVSSAVDHWRSRNNRRAPGPISGFASFGDGVVVAVAGLSLAWMCVHEARVIRLGLDFHRSPLYDCASAFTPLVPQGTLILASGGTCTNSAGFPVAYNAPYMFYWMDRKGFNVCDQQQSIEAVEEFARRGASYFVAEKRHVEKKPDFEEALNRTYPVVAECPSAWLFSIANPRRR